MAKLNEFQKWRNPSKNATIGDVVIVSEDNTPKSNWRLGRIEDTTTGRDGLVRSVMVKTARGVIRRPIQRLYLLEPALP